jgi:hypothetical protein
MILQLWFEGNSAADGDRQRVNLSDMAHRRKRTDSFTSVGFEKKRTRR